MCFISCQIPLHGILFTAARSDLWEVPPCAPRCALSCGSAPPAWELPESRDISTSVHLALYLPRSFRNVWGMNGWVNNTECLSGLPEITQLGLATEKQTFFKSWINALWTWVFAKYFSLSHTRHPDLQCHILSIALSRAHLTHPTLVSSEMSTFLWGQVILLGTHLDGGSRGALVPYYCSPQLLLLLLPLQGQKLEQHNWSDLS